jgi:hypothetical protein
VLHNPARLMPLGWPAGDLHVTATQGPVSRQWQAVLAVPHAGQKPGPSHLVPARDPQTATWAVTALSGIAPPPQARHTRGSRTHRSCHSH